MTMMVAFLSGMLAAMFAVASLFFIRFWRDTSDRLFFFFSFAFALLALQRVLLMFYAESALAYVPRLIAFALILVAIGEKNRARNR
jgi:hypothetical protein